MTRTKHLFEYFTFVGRYLLAGLLTLVTAGSIAQHHHHQPDLRDTTAMMTHAFSLDLPMNRNGSGTGWMPDATPVYAWMAHGDKWMYMLHGSVFFRYNMQNFTNDYRRGGKQFDAPNWLMGMMQRPVGDRGLLLLRAMVSLDRLTVGGDGYPLLFQTGETWRDAPLIDKQHPHDLFSELAVAYTWKLNDRTDLSVYAAYPGEPALGPTAFMHRISSMNNPDSPLGHHWQDATHVTFGVATVGLRWHVLKVEASSFTGREPDENRYNFDKPKFDSYSYRVSAHLTKNLVLQFSQGHIQSPEALRPEEDVLRTTASAIHSLPLGNDSYLASVLVWGYNDAGGHHKEHSVLAEGSLQKGRWATYGRFEWVQKSSEELGLAQFEDEIFDVNSVTLGANYQLNLFRSFNTTVGGQLTLNAFGSSLEPVYGTNPLSGQVYLRVMPPRVF